ncbi:MAG: hypothetical protein WKF70_10670, partial [Chitinophagaceae bacterium]
IINVLHIWTNFCEYLSTIKICHMQVNHEYFKENLAKSNFAYSLGLALPASLLLWLFILALVF